MVNYGGYGGKILRVDLTARKVYTQAVTDRMAELFLGGNGFGINLLYEEVPAQADPLGAENLLLFMVGPCQGTRVPAVGSRTAVLAKSPLTNLFMDSYFGGNFGAQLKYAGYDGLVIAGKAARPVYLYIKDEVVEIRDASDLWGKNTYECQVELADSLEEKGFSTACIGPAGEREVKMACIISGVHAAGRGGTGAVMGSKNLKAIAVKGSRGVAVPDIKALEQFCDALTERFKSNPATSKVLPTYGTAAIVGANNKLGLFGSKNWQSEVFEEADKINGDTLREQYFVKNSACFSCPIGCGKVNYVRQGKYHGALSVGPEYETLWSLGSNCGNGDLASLIAADRLCDELGIDTISCGGAIAMAMECYEKGIITAEDTGGLALKFGNPDTVLTLLKQIGYREGFGRILGEGTRAMARQYNAKEFAYETKGLEIPAHSPRGYLGMAMGYATSNRGGTHQDGRPSAERAGAVARTDPQGKSRYIIDVQRMTTLADCLIACRFTEGIFGVTGITQDMSDIVKYVTGMEKTVEELVEIADRVYALERAFNAREGTSRKDDTLPYRAFNEPIPEGPSKGQYFPREAFEKELDDYYLLRGWDRQTGWPTKETLLRLELAEVVKDLGY